MTKVMIGKTCDIAEGKVARIAAGGKEILIGNVGGQYYATGQNLQSLWGPAT